MINWYKKRNQYFRGGVISGKGGVISGFKFNYNFF